MLESGEDIVEMSGMPCNSMAYDLLERMAFVDFDWIADYSLEEAILGQSLRPTIQISQQS